MYAADIKQVHSFCGRARNVEGQPCISTFFKSGEKGAITFKLVYTPDSYCKWELHKWENNTYDFLGAMATQQGVFNSIVRRCNV